MGWQLKFYIKKLLKMVRREVCIVGECKKRDLELYS